MITAARTASIATYAAEIMGSAVHPVPGDALMVATRVGPGARAPGSPIKNDRMKNPGTDYICVYQRIAFLRVVNV